MPHNRRSRPRTPYDTRQAPIAWPWRRCGSPRAESDLCRVAFSYIQPSQRRIRPLPRQSFPVPNSTAAAAGRSPPPSPRSGSTPRRARGRGSLAVLQAPCSAQPRPLLTPRRDEPTVQPGQSLQPLTTTAAVCSLVAYGSNLIRLEVGPIPPTSGRFLFCEDAGSRSHRQSPPHPPQAPALEKFPRGWGRLQ